MRVFLMVRELTIWYGTGRPPASLRGYRQEDQAAELPSVDHVGPGRKSASDDPRWFSHLGRITAC
jgi:hypothetical protein